MLTHRLLVPVLVADQDGRAISLCQRPFQKMQTIINRSAMYRSRQAAKSASRNLRGSGRRGTLSEAVETVERELIQRALARHGGNKTKVSAELGISRWTLLQKMKAYGLQP